MSCRHDLASGTCIRCYPDNSYGRSDRDRIDPGPEEGYGPNLEGPGAVPAQTDRHIWFDRSSPPTILNPQPNDRDPILEIIHDLDRRVMQAEQDGFPQGRNIEREQPAALRRLLERADDYLGWQAQDARTGRPA